jgi:hypothetical protein
VAQPNRCDEIIQLIDEVLQEIDEQPRRDFPRAPEQPLPA